MVRPTFSATSTRSLLRWPRSQLLDVGVDMASACLCFCFPLGARGGFRGRVDVYRLWEEGKLVAQCVGKCAGGFMTRLSDRGKRIRTRSARASGREGKFRMSELLLLLLLRIISFWLFLLFFSWRSSLSLWPDGGGRMKERAKIGLKLGE